MVANPAQPNLNDRFNSCMRAMRGSECIDDLEMRPDQVRGKKADFLLLDRAVAVEVKSAVKDMAPKLQELVESLRAAGELGTSLGPASIEPFLRRSRQGVAIRQKLFRAVTSAVEKEIADANRQLRSTRELFDAPSAQGVLVYLNDRTDVVEPNLLAQCAINMLCRKREGGQPRFESLHAVLIISETHVVQFGAGPPLSPLVSVIREGLDDESDAASAVKRVEAAWAAWNGVPLVRTDLPSLDVLSHAQRTVERHRADNAAVAPRHEIFRRQYRANPYMSRLGDAEFVGIAGEVLCRLTCHFLRGSRKRLSEPELRATTESWTHVIEELNSRGIGIEELRARLGDPFWARVKRESGVEL